MLRKFKISVDGKEYLVEMEEIGTPPTPTAPPVTTSPEQVTSSEKSVDSTPVQPTTPASTSAMSAPMPGVILKLLVQVGDSVSENQPLMILEAMKMENEIVAGSNGIVQGIHVTQGQTVNAGDALITIN